MIRLATSISLGNRNQPGKRPTLKVFLLAISLTVTAKWTQCRRRQASSPSSAYVDPHRPHQRRPKASREQAKIAVEAGNLYSFLINLRFRIEAARSDAARVRQVKLLGVENGPLDQFKSILEKIVGHISTMRKRDQIKSALTSTLTKLEVDDALGRMERLKSLINYALTNDLLYRPLQYVRDWKVNTAAYCHRPYTARG